MRGTENTVLLVDDDPKLLRGLERSLSGESFRVLTAVSAYEATAILKMYQIDVIVSDNQMPGMSGTDFLALVRKDYPDIVPIVLTGNTVPVAIQGIEDLGVFRLLTKPCNASELVGVISQALRKKDLSALPES